jgi:ATP-dependent Clp protease adapter protein ClpS
MLNNLAQTNVKSGQTSLSVEVEATILIHSDDATPYEFLAMLLQTVFELSRELADHIVSVIGTHGSARVVTRPRSEAEILANRARAVALLNGFPLIISLEQNTHTCRIEWRRTIIRGSLCALLLLCAIGLALADGAGGITIHDILVH